MLYIFGDYALDETRYELRRSGASVAIEPKAFKVLVHLLQHRDRVVTKAELLEQCWPGVFVSESALTRCLASVRQAVHDEGPEQRAIKTIRGHGDRFVAAVATHITESAHPAIPETSHSHTAVEGTRLRRREGPCSCVRSARPSTGQGSTRFPATNCVCSCNGRYQNFETEKERAHGTQGGCYPVYCG